MSGPGWLLCHFKVTRWHRALGGAGGINLPGLLLSAGYLVKCFLNERLMEEEGWLHRTEPQGYPCRHASCQLPAPAATTQRGGFGSRRRTRVYKSPPRWGKRRPKLQVGREGRRESL